VGLGQFLVARYNLDGSLDTTFGSGGKRLVEIGQIPALALAIDGNDRIVLAGYSEVSDADDFDFAVARLSPDGSLDTTFGGGDGTVTADFGDEDQGYAVTTDSLDRIIVAGARISVTMSP